MNSPGHQVTKSPTGDLGSLTTEYSANGSFSDHTHAVCMGAIACWDLGFGIGDSRAASNPESRIPDSGRRKPEFLMVKLLRVYGECLGTRSR